MPLRRAEARINLAAIERNAARMCACLSRGADLCAVVKADAYGHGAVPAARAALAGGARALAVATAEEAVLLREAGIESPMLVMGALSLDELALAVAVDVDIVAWSAEFIEAVIRAHAERPVRVHVKLDTGMGRLGTRSVAEALAVAERASAAHELELAGAMTHFATSDDDLDYLAAQLAVFEPFVSELREHHPAIIVHAANSAATLREPASHFDLVRCGIALYGCDPMHENPDRFGLEPAMELVSYVAAVKPARAGESVGYGRRFVAEQDTWIATVPIGYGDGVRRALTNNCDVLIGGRRYPLVGTVSMDNITVDVATHDNVRPGQTATIIGRDGAERQLAEELAHRLGTINYEVVCSISSRVTRVYHRDGAPVGS